VFHNEGVAVGIGVFVLVGWGVNDAVGSTVEVRVLTWTVGARLDFSGKKLHPARRKNITYIDTTFK
jgi:hypothetical protein